MSWLIDAGMSAVGLPYDARFEWATKNPEEAQRRILAGLMRVNADSAFGREHSFAKISTPAEYAKAVSIRDYEKGVRPYINRVLKGEKRVLTGEEPLMFVTSSGTTGEPKLIPVTPWYRKQITDYQRLWLSRITRDNPGAMDHVMNIANPAVEKTTETGFALGSTSGLVNNSYPWFVMRRRALPEEVSLVREYEARYFLAMRLGLEQAVSMIYTANPTTLIRLAQTLQGRAQEMIRAVHDGTLGLPDPELFPGAGRSREEVLAAIKRRVSPNPRRAKALEALIARGGKLLPKDCWPSLKLITCWVGGSVGAHARHLPEYYGDPLEIRDIGYIGSEMRMAMPVENNTSAGVPTINMNFLEFVPEDQIDDPAPATKLAHELEDGKRYYIIVTGGHGLYRYDMNDIVEVRGFYNRTPKIAFVRKGRDMLSITGEKLHVNQVQEAIVSAEKGVGLKIWQYRLVPDVEGCRYDLLLELEASADAARVPSFGRAFDEALARINLEYLSRRQSRRLKGPKLHLMRSGWTERLTKADVQAGKRQAQYKWRHLALAWDPISQADRAETVEIGEVFKA